MLTIKAITPVITPTQDLNESAFSLLYTAIEMSNSSEVQSSDDLRKYISEPSYLVGVEAKNQPLEAISTSWLGDLDSNQDKRGQNPLSYH